MANNDIVGKDANKDPKKVFDFDISEIKTITNAERINLTK
tara:strand:- start:108 stop:227 length:120 start_codon:yes stop_codon:yes gene_type:complete